MQPLFPFPLSRNEGLDKQEVQLRSLVSCSCDSLCHFFFTPSLVPPALYPISPPNPRVRGGGKVAQKRNMKKKKRGAQLNFPASRPCSLERLFATCRCNTWQQFCGMQEGKRRGCGSGEGRGKGE